jgi:hypothetical protein
VNITVFLDDADVKAGGKPTIAKKLVAKDTEKYCLGEGWEEVTGRKDPKGVKVTSN